MPAIFEQGPDADARERAGRSETDRAAPAAARARCRRETARARGTRPRRARCRTAPLSIASPRAMQATLPSTRRVAALVAGVPPLDARAGRSSSWNAGLVAPNGKKPPPTSWTNPGSVSASLPSAPPARRGFASSTSTRNRAARARGGHEPVRPRANHDHVGIAHGIAASFFSTEGAAADLGDISMKVL